MHSHFIKTLNLNNYLTLIASINKQSFFETFSNVSLTHDIQNNMDDI